MATLDHLAETSLEEGSLAYYNHNMKGIMWEIHRCIKKQFIIFSSLG